MKRKIVKRAPIEAITRVQLNELSADNIEVGNYWIQIVGNGTITVCQQAMGEFPTQKINIPRATFDKLARWYTTGNKAKPKRKAVKRG